MSNFDLAAFSDAVAEVAAAATPALASFERGHGTASAFHWRDGLYVTAEEALPDTDELDLTLASGAGLKGAIAGRDPTTGVALIRTSGGPADTIRGRAGAARAGSLAIAVGQTGGDALASLGTVALAGPAWRSMRGGHIASRINLAITAGGRFEGGAVLDAAGSLIGMLLFGPRRRVLVMPHENIEQSVAILSTKGHVARGYLGAGLHPVRSGETRGAMVMGLDADGPALRAGMLVGDIITTWNGETIEGPRGLMRRLGPDSAGKTVTLGLVRGGRTHQMSVVIGEKPLG